MVARLVVISGRSEFGAANLLSSAAYLGSAALVRWTWQSSRNTQLVVILPLEPELERVTVQAS